VRPPRGTVKHALRTSFRFSTLQFAASRMTIRRQCGAEDDEQFRRKAQRSIVLNEGRHEGRERRRADAESGSRVGAARRVGCGRAVANRTRGKENLGSPLGSIGLARSGSASSHAPGSGNSHAIHLHRKMSVHSMMRCDSYASRRAKHTSCVFTLALKHT
jgi:hypothetical protein